MRVRRVLVAIACITFALATLSAGQKVSAEPMREEEEEPNPEPTETSEPTEPSPFEPSEGEAADPTSEEESPAAAEGPAKPQSPPGTVEIKGELTQIGTKMLVSRFDHAGVRIGPSIIDKDFFLSVTPQAAFYPGNWAIGLQVPLNLLALEAGSLEFGGFRLRKRDWDEPGDFTRIVRFISYGRKETGFFISVNSMTPTTLGHGGLMYHYQPNIDVDRSRTGFTLDLYNRLVGAQLQLSDVTFDNRVLGGLVFIKPFGFLEKDKHPLLTSLSLGIEYVGDFAAPRCIQASEREARCLTGGPTEDNPLGNQAGLDPLTGRGRDDTFARTDSDLGRPVVEEIGVHAIGASVEMRVLSEARSNVKVYGVFDTFVDHGSGFALGSLARLTLGQTMLNAFRLRGELRTFAPDFLPGYFDTLYEVNKYQYFQAQAPHQIIPTKYQAVFGDPNYGFNLEDQDQRVGFNLEVAWALYDGSQDEKRIGVGFGFGDSSAEDDTNFYAHLELPILRYLQIFGTFMSFNAGSVGDLFAGNTDNIVVLTGARAQILPFMFVNAHYSRSFEIIKGPGREFHLGNANVVDEQGQTSPFFTTERIYENVQTLLVELEIGLEFKE